MLEHLSQFEGSIRVELPSTTFNGLCIVGEAPGEEEALVSAPFVGKSGQELDICLKQNGIARSECILTNVVPCRPSNNKFETFCCGRAQAVEEYKDKVNWLKKTYPNFPWPDRYNFPPLGSGKYLKPAWLFGLAELYDLLLTRKPNLVLALGGTALWALCEVNKIGKYRGAVINSTLIRGQKVLPTWHPAAVLRQWSLRPQLVADINKASKELHFPEIVRPKRLLYINPTIYDIHQWTGRLWNQIHNPNSICAFDIETEPSYKLVSCMGFSFDEQSAYIVPFFGRGYPDGSYWPNVLSERIAWKFCRLILEGPCKKVAHNSIYDISWNWRILDLKIKNFSDDTMLLQHALQPEFPKSLGFCGSLLTTEPSWKLYNPKRQKDQNKRED